MTSTGQPGEEATVPPVGPEPKPRRRFRRIRALVDRLPPPPRSRRGLFVLVLLVAGIGSVMTVGGVVALKWTETAGFCGRCHTMGPELKAYAMSAHREVPCAECHVAPGVTGWVKAKMTGTKQLFQVITGSFPKPIPPPDHASLPSVKDTCMRCHSLEEITEGGGPLKVVFRPRYREDQSNTRELIAVVVRPVGLGGNTGVRGVHWHVEQQVDFMRADARSQKIDWVGVTFEDGTSKQFIAQSEVSISSNVQPDIDRLKRTESARRMDCIECHNRVGHEVPRPGRVIDDSIAVGKISQDLPYIKRDGVALVTADYPSLEAADQAIAGIRETYATKYPLVLEMRGQAVTEAIDELQRIYRLVATPEMKVSAATYPNNLGHQTAPGCFRCHDGAHYRVVDGRLTDETIPSACATCHTFPQVGSTVSDLLLLGEPTDHKDRLWVFDHRTKVSRLDPAGTTCGACHTRTYCANCHNTGAAKVQHDEMLYNHPDAIAKSGLQACAYCHQPVVCARCHENPVLSSPGASHVGAALDQGAPPVGAVVNQRAPPVDAALDQGAPPVGAVVNQRAPPSTSSEPETRAIGVSKTARAQTREEWLTVHEACALIGVSPATLRRWSDAGDIRTFTTPGGHRRFARSAILGLLPVARGQRPKLERLGETPEHMIRVYRRHLAEACDGVPWIGGLDDDELRPFRDHGRRIATSLLGFIDATTPEEHELAIEDAVRSAAEYGRIAARCDVGMSQTVEAFLRFRSPFLRELAAVARRRGLDTAEATDLLQTATEAIDLLLSSLMSGHTPATAEPSPVEVIPR